ncbi:MAG: sigma-70 family RNA polymerase sigma factor [Bacteroidia bacterium]|nr:sigma-70 family RNA polymerase sigma factor [Bacteroidia bacterium]
MHLGSNDKYNSDEYIITALRNNDDRVLEVLYKLYFGMVVHFIITNSGSEDDAKDIFQEAVIVFYQKIKNNNDFELNCKIKTYLYSVSRNLWLKRIKKASSVVGKITDYENYVSINSDDELEMQERELQFGKMAEALTGLGEPCKSLIEDFYIHQLSMAEITDKFGYTNSDNAKTQKYKCLQRLKKLFFKQKD